MSNMFKIKNRTIFEGDNLDGLRRLPDNSVDMIYLDPQFNSNEEYEAPIGSPAEGAGFIDKWTLDYFDVNWMEELMNSNDILRNRLHAAIELIGIVHSNEMMGYSCFMAMRLFECKRVLKPTGSIYLHCDDAADAYLRMLMDAIFGAENFRNAITTRRMKGNKGNQYTPKQFGRNTYTIYYYVMSDDVYFNPMRPLTPEEAAEKFDKMDDETGARFYDDSAHIFRSPGLGPRPNLCYEWRGFKNPHPSGWRMKKERLEEEYQKGNIVILPNGKLQRRKYERDHKGIKFNTFWDDIPPLSDDEDTGYPTQKPVFFLQRLIRASSRPNDIILDPFCGCAGACVAAESLGRQWIGMDISPMAVKLVRDRMHDELGFFGQINHVQVPPC